MCSEEFYNMCWMISEFIIHPNTSGLLTTKWTNNISKTSKRGRICKRASNRANIIELRESNCCAERVWKVPLCAVFFLCLQNHNVFFSPPNDKWSESWAKHKIEIINQSNTNTTRQMWSWRLENDEIGEVDSWCVRSVVQKGNGTLVRPSRVLQFWYA